MDLTGLVTGLTQGLNSYLGDQNKLKGEMQKEQYKTQLASQLEQQKATLNNQEASYKNNLEDVLTPDMAEKALPGYGAKMVQEYNTQRPDNPLKLKEGVSFLKAAIDKLDKKNEAQAKSDDIRLSQYGRSLQADREFTLIRNTRDNIEKVGALLDQIESQPDGPDKRQLYENSVAQMRVLAQSGQISEREIEHLLPSTYQGSFAGFLEKITNEPQGTEAQAFMKRARDFFHREAETTNNQLARRVNELSAPYKHVLERNPDTAAETFQTYGVIHPKYNPKKIEEKTAPRKGMIPPENDPLGLFK